MSQQYDFVAIGDLVVDAFIELNKDEADVSIDMDTGRKTLLMKFGGKVPYNDVVVVNAVGNSPNAAVSAHRLGLNSTLISSVGHDTYGSDCLEQLRSEGMSTEYVKIHEGMKTNYHYVLQYGPERTILIKHEKFPYMLPNFDVPPRFIYLSSIGEHGVEHHFEVAKYVKEHSETKLVFQPGTFQIKLGVEKLKHLYEVTEIFFCNKEEAQLILNTEEQHFPTLLKGMKELGPKLPVITDGPAGAYVLDENNISWHMPMYPDPIPPISRTGAGDAFASTFTSAIAYGLSPSDALSWAPINSMSVVQHIGAQKGLLTREVLLEYLKNAPEDYKARQIE